MPSTIPNMRSVNRMPSAGTQRRRFIASPGSFIKGVLTGARRQRAAVNEIDQMKSVAGIPAGTAALNAQRAVYETASPGERLTI